MHLSFRSRFRLGLVVVAAGLIATTTSLAADSAEAPFLAENQAAMDKMMAGMEVKSSGEADHDFASMMIAHHQGAIEMARAELHYGHNELLRRIAQEIIVEQQQEIDAMRLALSQPLSPAGRSPRPAGGRGWQGAPPGHTPTMNMR